MDLMSRKAMYLGNASLSRSDGVLAATHMESQSQTSSATERAVNLGHYMLANRTSGLG